MCLESKRLDERIHSLHSQIESLPEGKIICAPNGNVYKWYRSDGHKSSKAEDLLVNKPGYQELLSSYFKPQSQEINDWLNAPFEQNPKYPGNKIHKTSSGNLVRSKSEALIDMILYTNKIPFRYECALRLGDYTIYPDYTIMHPKTGRIVYWEHFGRMDDPKYNKNVGERLQTYIDYGIIPSIDLITTFETLDRPLSTEEIEKIVNEYFLS